MSTKEENIEPIIVTSTPATKEAEEWHAFGLKIKQESPNRLEDAAKFLSGLIAVCFTIFLNGSPSFIKDLHIVLQAITAFLWFITLFGVVMVLYPRKYDYHKSSAESIEKMHGQVVKHKLLWLQFTTVCFLSAFVWMSTLYFCRLWELV